MMRGFGDTLTGWRILVAIGVLAYIWGIVFVCKMIRKMGG